MAVLRFLKREDYTAERELMTLNAAYKLLVCLPYAAQFRIIRHLAEIFEERHAMRYVPEDEAGNGL